MIFDGKQKNHLKYFLLSIQNLQESFSNLEIKNKKSSRIIFKPCN